MKIKKGDTSAKWVWSGRGVKFRDAEYIKFDQYTSHDHQKCRTYKFIFWKDKLIFNMINWVPYRTDPKTGKVYLKGYPEALMGDNDKSKYEWGTSLWEWLSKDSRAVNSLKSIVK